MQRNLCIQLIKVLPYFSCFMQRNLCIQLIESSTIFFMFYAEESLYSADQKFYHIFHVLCRGIFVFSWLEVLPYFSCFMQRNLCIHLIGSSTIFFLFYAEESSYSFDRKFYHIFSCFMQRNLRIQLIRSSTKFFLFYAEESLYSADRKFYHIFSCFMQRNLRIQLIRSSTIFFLFYAEESLYSSDRKFYHIFSCFMQRNLCIQLIESSTIFFMFYAEESLYSADRKFYPIFYVLCRGIFVFSWSEVLPYFSCFMQRNLCIQLIESSTIFFMFYAEESFSFMLFNEL